MFVLKLGLVAASVLLASLAARRYGHAVAGALAGMPVIAGPIMIFVLLQQPLVQASGIALATLACLPATILHLVAFAVLAAAGAPWWLGLGAANLVFLGAGWALGHLALPDAAIYALALLAPALGLLALRPCARSAGGVPAGGPVPVPRSELAWRVAAALAMAAVIMLGADVLPVAVSGLLLAIPIAGNVLPCFTLPRHGAQASIALLGGFVRGLFGFAAFFVALHAGLPALGPGGAVVAALGAALGAALAVHAASRWTAQR